VGVGNPRSSPNGFEELNPAFSACLGTDNPDEDGPVQGGVGGQPLLDITVAAESHLERISVRE
jgi:hypothetical protein